MATPLVAVAETEEQAAAAAMAMTKSSSQTIAAHAAPEPSTKNAANERPRELLSIEWRQHAAGRAVQRL